METKKGLFKWSIWIGLVTAIYCLIYVSISPLASKGVVWCTFVALPIFFTSGAQKNEIPNYIISCIVGVIWGWVFVYVLTWSASYIPFDNVNNMVVCGTLTIICCAIHFCLTEKTFANKVNMMFGAIACTLSQGGSNLIPIMITMIGGILLAYICVSGQNLIDENGNLSVKGKRSK